MLGHLMEWLFSGLGGIRQKEDSFGFKHIVIKPEPVGDVRDAQVSYESPYGQIVSDWKDNDKEFIIRVEVPANSKASVYLPVCRHETNNRKRCTIGRCPRNQLQTRRKSVCRSNNRFRYLYFQSEEK